MRQIICKQMQLGECAIAHIPIDVSSRDEIPKTLLGLQYIYRDRPTRRRLFKALEKLIPPGVRMDTGRKGMDLWRILVMGALRLSCNWDYDHLHDQVNNHHKIRQMLGHGLWDFSKAYNLQTIKDNVRLFTPAVLAEINRIVVKSGHDELFTADAPLKAKVDSFVVETNVHYPTDINLLWDAMRTLLILTPRLCETHAVTGWRQHKSWLAKLKAACRVAQLSWRGRPKKPSNPTTKKLAAYKRKLAAYQNHINHAHQTYIDKAQCVVNMVNTSLAELPATASSLTVGKIQTFVAYADRQIDQIHRRVLKGEQIDHSEKIFSLFQPHTRWISKGKAGTPYELGVPVCVMEDQYGFLLDSLVMETGVDKTIAVSFIQQVKAHFSNLNQCSLDKGFYSPDNQTELADILEVVILPKKGRLSKSDMERESKNEFVKAKRQHAAIESAINGLESGGLDRCPDHGIEGFKRYVKLAVLARNLHRLGTIIQQKEKEKQVRRIA